jgi:hypothetical protein
MGINESTPILWNEQEEDMPTAHFMGFRGTPFARWWREVTHMAKYGQKASEKVERAMHERKRGTLKSGRSGKKVTSRKQAIAIGLSEARRAGGKVPRKKTGRKGGRSRSGGGA